MQTRIVAIALMASVAACSGPKLEDVAIRPINGQASGTAQDALVRGDLLFSRGEYALSLDAYRRALRSDPADAHALNGVAISYAAMGRHDLARDYFELALARTPQDARIYRNFARSLRAQGLHRQADALLAEFDPAVAMPRPGARPTLAQLAAAPAAPAPARLAGATLERVSSGEVFLKGSDQAVAGRRTPQLTTAIVTVAVTDAAGQEPAVTGKLTKALSAPIVTIGAARPATLAGEDAVDGAFMQLWQEWRGNGRG